MIEPSESSIVGGLDPATEDLVLGRYRVTTRLGEGGMGVVVLATDLELKRQVALKVLKRRDGARPEPDAIARLLREAQALARLSDPHVVPVYDVGWEKGDLVVAMEYVAGQTLAKWLKAAPPWRSVLDAFAQAGRGLAAAHAAGLVHRDFKLDNVIVGDDGRVRVLDFGLARAWESASMDGSTPSGSGRPYGSGSSRDEITEAGIVLGTPMYMSPEQHYGGAVGPASDQFGFCVALYRALFGQPPFAGDDLAALAANKAKWRVRDPPTGSDVPPHVLAAVRRGLAPEPEARWPGMVELLSALEPRTRARRWPLALSAVGVLGVGAAFASAPREPACSDPAARLEGVWDATRRAEVDTALRGVDAGYAASTAERVLVGLDAYAQAWADAESRACDPDEEVESASLARVRDCLTQRLGRLGGTIDTLATTTDREALQGALPAVAALPSIEACESPQALAAEPIPDLALRRQVDQAREILADADAQRAAGRLEPATHRAREALAQAQSIGWEPLIADARLLLGEILAHDGRHEEAEAVLEQALHGAAAAGRQRVVVDAAAGLVGLVGGHLSRFDDALFWARHGEAATARGGVEPLAEARLYARTGSVLSDAARFDEARAKFDRALELTREAVGEEHGDYAALLYDVAGLELEQGRHAEAIALLQRALELREAYFGPDHPVVASVLTGLGRAASETNDAAAADRYFSRALKIKEAAFGPDHPSLAIVVTNLAAMKRLLEEPDEARALYLRALQIAEKGYGADHARVAQVLVNLGGLEYTQGEYDEARGRFERALGIMERTLGEDHPNVAVVLNNLGLLLDTTGDRERAIEIHARALAIREKTLPAGHASIALSHCNLGQALLRTDRFEQALSHYDAAVPMFEAALRSDDPDVAYALTGRGEALLGLQRPEDATEALERAVATYEAAKFESSALGRARFDLARALRDAGSDRRRALELAAAAEADFRAAGAELFATELADIAAWRSG